MVTFVAANYVLFPLASFCINNSIIPKDQRGLARQILTVSSSSICREVLLPAHCTVIRGTGISSSLHSNFVVMWAREVLLMGTMSQAR